MTDSYNNALHEQLKKNVWDTLQQEAKQMSPMEYATTAADIAGIFDPTPVSDAAGLALSAAQGDGLGAALSLAGLFPYAGDALAKPLKFAKKAPQTAKALEALLDASDHLAMAGQAALQRAGLSLGQVAAARSQALAKVRQAMLDVKQGKAGCVECRLVGEAGEKRRLQMPRSNDSINGGKWDTKGNKQPEDGNGTFVFNNPRQLPDGRIVKEINFDNGTPVYNNFVEGRKYDLWEMTGDVQQDSHELTRMMRETTPDWKPPSKKNFVLHHFEDGTVGYIPREIHDIDAGGVAHTGGNSMTNNKLF